jgi:DNA-binding PadR family transcriptional regulator
MKALLDTYPGLSGLGLTVALGIIIFVIIKALRRGGRRELGSYFVLFNLAGRERRPLQIEDLAKKLGEYSRSGVVSTRLRHILESLDRQGYVEQTFGTEYDETESAKVFYNITSAGEDELDKQSNHSQAVVEARLHREFRMG